MEPELVTLLFIQLLGSTIFAVFELETPIWKKLLKWSMLDAITIGLYFLTGHWALLFPTIILITGITVHVRFCRKHGIDPLKATPRKKYYELRGWKWNG